MQKKITVTALQPFAHGNVVGVEGGVYAMNAGDARELEKAGFVKIGGEGDAEQTQIDHPPMKPEPGDVVADDEPDILGAKMDNDLENKMQKPTANKTTAKK